MMNEDQNIEMEDEIVEITVRCKIKDFKSFSISISSDSSISQLKEMIFMEIKKLPENFQIYLNNDDITDNKYDNLILNKIFDPLPLKLNVILVEIEKQK